MHQITRITALGLLAACCLLACRPKAGAPAEASSSPLTELSGFEEFYHQFMRDSAYQMEHIVFPLEGLPDSADSLTMAEGTFRWQAEDWRMHRTFDNSAGNFTIQFEVVGQDIVVERIIHRSGDFGMLRRFARLGDEWHLIYYAGMNRLRRSESGEMG